jgi:hypothetical protein
MPAALGAGAGHVPSTQELQPAASAGMGDRAGSPAAAGQQAGTGREAAPAGVGASGGSAADSGSGQGHGRRLVRRNSGQLASLLQRQRSNEELVRSQHTTPCLLSRLCCACKRTVAAGGQHSSSQAAHLVRHSAGSCPTGLIQHLHAACCLVFRVLALPAQHAAWAAHHMIPAAVALLLLPAGCSVPAGAAAAQVRACSAADADTAHRPGHGEQRTGAAHTYVVLWHGRAAHPVHVQAEMQLHGQGTCACVLTYITGNRQSERGGRLTCCAAVCLLLLLLLLLLLCLAAACTCDGSRAAAANTRHATPQH